LALGLLKRKRRIRVAEIQLMHLAATAYIAPPRRIEQAIRQAEHARCDRPAFFFVAVEQ
jgi:hypothetical protein